MNCMLGNMWAGKTDSTVNMEGGQTKADIWKEALEMMIDPTSGMGEQERANYEQKIMQKLKSGRRLTAEEMDYLRIHNPEMYQIAVRVENERKALKTKLNNCKSKEEVQQVISVQMEALKAMKGDPAQEYMTAMVEKEVSDFKKTSEYARLPQKREKGNRMAEEEEFSKKSDNDTKEDGKLFKRAAAYGRMQVQCNQIGNLAQSFVAMNCVH